MSRQKEDPYLKAYFEEEKRLFPDESKSKRMTRREEIRLRTYADRYAKICYDLKQQEERKRKTGEMLQQEMERQGVTKAEGLKASVALVSGDRITGVNSLQFYNAVSEQLKPKAWKALSVLISKRLLASWLASRRFEIWAKPSRLLGSFRNGMGKMRPQNQKIMERRLRNVPADGAWTLAILADDSRSMASAGRASGTIRRSLGKKRIGRKEYATDHGLADYQSIVVLRVAGSDA